MRIFVVENHSDTLKYLIKYLQGLGHTVFDARTQAEALAAIPASRCDVLISDIGLPDGDGWSLLRTLGEDVGSCPPYSIAMSGFGMNADRQRSQAAGYREHLLKPFDPKDLDKQLELAADELHRGVNPL